MPTPYYKPGVSLSVASGGTAVTGVTTAFLAEVKAGDVLWNNGVGVGIASVETNTGLTLIDGWPNANLAGGSTDWYITRGPQWAATSDDGAYDVLETIRQLLADFDSIPDSGGESVGAVDVASAATADLGAVDSRFVRITGTTTITSFGTAPPGIYRIGYFADSLTLTHGAGIVLPGGGSITTATNDRFAALSLSPGIWLVLFYTRANGLPLNPNLATIAGLTPTLHNVIQSVAPGVWASQTPAQLMAVLGALGQIPFPTTQIPSADPNTLDDYEEGTFTPGIEFGGAAVGMGFSARAGSYTKVGRHVFGGLIMILSAKGSSTGNATLTGLPFSNGQTTSANAVFAAMTSGVGDTMLSIALFNSTAFNPYKQAAGSISQLTHADFGNSSQIYLGFQYLVT